jgi:hypothetical protein
MGARQQALLVYEKSSAKRSFRGIVRIDPRPPLPAIHRDSRTATSQA